MTDAEKMMQLMMAMGVEAREQTQVQFDTMAEMLMMMYNSYIKAGFSYKMAFELVKTFLSSTIQGIVKK